MALVQYSGHSRLNDSREHVVSDDESASDRDDGCCAACDCESSDEKQEQYRYMNGSVPGYVRNDFVKKVYMILTVQLLVTIAIAAAIMSVPVESLESIGWSRLMQINSIAILIFACAMQCCCQQQMRTFPINYVMLFIFTVMMAALVGTATVGYNTSVVLEAAGLTMAMFLALTAYACVTKTDFTGLGPYLYCALWGLIFASIVCFMFPSELGHVAIAALGCVLFSFYIIYDTQLIIGGRHSQSFAIDDYCFAALNLYLDIINLFLYLLQLLGRNGE